VVRGVCAGDGAAELDGGAMGTDRGGEWMLRRGWEDPQHKHAILFSAQGKTFGKSGEVYSPGDGWAWRWRAM
jgi:hypothetical protein